MKSLSFFPKLKKGDIIVFILIGIVIFISLVTFYRPQKEAKVLKIYRDGKEYATYSLSQPYTKNLSIPAKDGYKTGYSNVKIENGTVKITESSCPNKNCIKMGTISQEGDVLICLPYRLVFRLEGGEAIDAVSY